MATFGGGVGVDATTGGVWVRWVGAGDTGVFKAPMSRASPSGRLITMAALFFARTKADGVDGAFCVVWELTTAGVIEGV